ncbi:MAG: 23S rRNA (pseudouridine(1915)-N(3))-methyltransferase RlmH [Chromatiales bacterium]|nr:23S rRNA (pseudouridine(1915)-N(3))-methyltransferase RlmH [Gammaproteobacteria bacterium]MBW6475558.1 23S rRNA (pseudouridine(1915)-N(3))-methyltransferase RlmH [Chromatiales bacterium]
MNIHLIAVGQRMPNWVEQGYQEFAKRLPNECRLVLHEIPAPKRGKNVDIDKLRRQEADKINASLPKGARLVALEVGGKPWSTEQLAQRIGEWMGEGRDVALLVGGPDGLEPGLSQRADEQWSLSPLTLPHPLVRVILAEQIYRAWSILKGHPYHRG